MTGSVYVCVCVFVKLMVAPKSATGRYRKKRHWRLIKAVASVKRMLMGAAVILKQGGNQPKTAYYFEWKTSAVE